MREYGRDAKYDSLLDNDELKKFTYKAHHVGKVIQIFMQQARVPDGVQSKSN